MQNKALSRGGWGWEEQNLDNGLCTSTDNVEFENRNVGIGFEPVAYRLSQFCQAEKLTQMQQI